MFPSNCYCVLQTEQDVGEHGAVPVEESAEPVLVGADDHWVDKKDRAPAGCGVLRRLPRRGGVDRASGAACPARGAASGRIVA